MIGYNTHGFNAFATGGYAIDGSHQEVDLGVSYTASEFTIGISDYYYPTSVGEKDQYFKLSNRETGHWVETYATWAGTKVPLWVTVSTYIFGADKNNEGMTSKSMSPIQTATGPAGFVGAMMWRGGNTYIGYCLFTLLNLPYTIGQFIYHSLRSNHHGKPNRYNLLAKKERNVLSVCFTRMTPKEVFVKFYKRIKK